MKWPFHDSNQLGTFPYWYSSIKLNVVFFKSHGKLPKTNFRDSPQIKYCLIWKFTELKLVFGDFPWLSKNTTLSLMLEYQYGNVTSWLESWNGNFERSITLRFGIKKVLFYLVKWPKCCFEWLFLIAVFSTRRPFDG